MITSAHESVGRRPMKRRRESITYPWFEESPSINRRLKEERRRADVWFTLFNRRLNVDYKVNLTSNRIDWRLFFLLPSPSVHPKRSLEILVLLIRFAYATKIYEPKVKYEDVSHHSIEDWRPTIINDHQPKVGNNGWAGGWVLMSWVSN